MSRGRRVSTLILACIGVLAVVALGAWRATYHDWPWQGDPSRVSWCGRHYDAVPGLVSVARLERGVVHTEFRVPPLIGRGMISIRDARTATHPLKAPGEPCNGSLYLDHGGYEYRAYGLSGGP